MEEPAGPGGVREETASLARARSRCRAEAADRASAPGEGAGSGAEPAVEDCYFGIDGFGAGLVLYGFAQL